MKTEQQLYQQSIQENWSSEQYFMEIQNDALLHAAKICLEISSSKHSLFSKFCAQTIIEAAKNNRYVKKQS